MNKKRILNLVIPICLIIILVLTINVMSKSLKKDNNSKKMKATILSVENSKVILSDQNDNIYVFSPFDYNLKSGDNLIIKYTGLLSEKKNQSIEVIDYKKIDIAKDENGIPLSWKDDGIFSDYYIMAFNKLKKLTLDEKIGQLLLARYPDNNAIDALKKYKLSGFVFFEKDFRGKTQKEVQNMIDSLQKTANIPLLTAVDEEGGNVVRVSSNNNLVAEKFKSPKELYDLGGFQKIKEDTINKSDVLNKLRLNLNLAPVVDVSTNPSDYMYPRTIGQNTAITSTYAETVIEASKKTNVSYTLKHFPGYGNNSDTHTGSSVDNRSYNDILTNDIPPFKSGIKAGAEAVLVSHNIVTNIDSDNPASLSPAVHNLLRNNLNFTGVTITDDISMGALSSITDPTIKAILAGNNLIITTDYVESFNELKNAIKNGAIDEIIIDKSVFKILAWKYYKGLMFMK